MLEQVETPRDPVTTTYHAAWTPPRTTGGAGSVVTIAARLQTDRPIMPRSARICR
jgi:hypothetical protein